VTLPVDVLMVDAYAVALLAAAGGLEWLARHTAVRSERFRTAGFTYHAARDLWVCPQDQPLWPHELDRERRVMRYRGRPSICNACPAKHRCTDSEDGREVVRPIDPWPHSEAGRFHRGLSVVLTLLACCFLVGGIATSREAATLLVGLPLLAAASALTARWTLDLLRTPSGFPDDPAGRWARPTTPPVEAPTRSAGPVLVDLVPPTRRTSAGGRWGSDGRQPGGRYRPRPDESRSDESTPGESGRGR
jgi:hypothetical protein